MKIVKISKILTESDITELNTMAPVIIELESTKGQRPEVIEKIDEKNIIKIMCGIDENIINANNEVQMYSRSLYTARDVANIIREFEKIEKPINQNWTTLQKATYIYTQLMQRIAHSGFAKVEIERATNNLNGMLAKVAQPSEYATILKEALARLDIPCTVLSNGEQCMWNEIEIDGLSYPADLGWDAEDYYSGRTEGKLALRNYLVDGEFYDRPGHKTFRPETKRLLDIKPITSKDIEEALAIISDLRTDSEIEMKKEEVVVEPPKIELKSKELKGLFSEDTISKESIEETKPLTISVKDNDFSDLQSDIRQIGKYYPQLLSNIEIENTSSEKSNLQDVVNEIYEARKTMPEAQNEESHLSITISSEFEEDFDLDFSNAPRISQSNSRPIDGKESQAIIFKNKSANPIRLKNIGSKISNNIGEVEFSGFDLQDVDLQGTGIHTIRFSNGTVNFNAVGGLSDIPKVEINNVPMRDFNDFMSNVYPTSSRIFSVKINNQNLSNRKIMQELAVNNNLTLLEISRCRLNDLDGLEQLNGRLTILILEHNENEISDIPKIQEFVRKNPQASVEFIENSRVINGIDSYRDEISDETEKLIKDIVFRSGTYGSFSPANKARTVEYLLSYPVSAPFYIKDAEVIRKRLGIVNNPMMLENESEIDSVNFDADYLKGGELLLTIPQAEKLIQSGKVIPQDIKIVISDVTELSSDKLKELNTNITAKGMSLSGVRIFDSKHNNTHTQIYPYTVSQYVFIRDTLEKVVEGINPADSDIDKFAVIYSRFVDSIVYDHAAVREGNRAEALYYAQKRYPSRNMLQGLEEGKCVCAGYADLLRNALALVGIESRLVSGLAHKNDKDSGHAWNQVKMKDSNGNERWYYTDLTWDAGQKLRNFEWTLRGTGYFMRNSHDKIYTNNIEQVGISDFDRDELQRAFGRARGKTYNFRAGDRPITIPPEPSMNLQLDEDRIKDEFKRRRDDMLAKYYGNRDYRREYTERAARHRAHEVETTVGGITYRTINDYAEKEDDEKFLLLDKYKASLERATRYEAGDTSVYQGTPDQIDVQHQSDREYVDTRNHTFDQNKTKQQDLATLGKYGERVPYIPRQNGVLRNSARIIGNAAIFTRNLISPVYRGIGRYVAQPIHRLVTRGRDASPYRNNIYHRIVARRDYFQDVARQRDIDETQRRISNAVDPSQVRTVNHTLRNALEARFKAVFNVKEGNEAVLRAGAADIIENIRNQEKDRAYISALNQHINAVTAQITQLEAELLSRPGARNASDVKQAIADKKAIITRCQNRLAQYAKNGIEGDIQTDAISSSQHAIASKEVTTFETTVIKGFAKGAAVKLVGPKIHTWLAQRGKVTQTREIPDVEWQQQKEWVPATYKLENSAQYQDVVDTSKTLREVMNSNKGKQITGFYSVSGGERSPATYTLTGDENITAVFQSIGQHGTGLADTVDLTAPRLVDRTFTGSMLNPNGLLKQDLSINDLVEALNTGTVDLNTLQDVYVSVGDRYWTKLSDLVGGVTKSVKVKDLAHKVIDVPGHYETVNKLVRTSHKVTEVVNNPISEKAVNISDSVLLGGAYMDGILDVIENVRPTTTDVKSNKKRPRKYDYDDEELRNEQMPTSKDDYDRTR